MKNGGDSVVNLYIYIQLYLIVKYLYYSKSNRFDEYCQNLQSNFIEMKMYLILLIVVKIMYTHFK